MYTISDIMADVDRHCTINNLNEDSFSYRIIYYIKEGNTGKRCCVDAAYKDLQKAMESIIRKNLSMENSVSISGVTVRNKGKCVCLLGRAYKFSLEEYFCQIYGKGRKRKAVHGRYTVNAN